MTQLSTIQATPHRPKESWRADLNRGPADYESAWGSSAGCCSVIPLQKSVPTGAIPSVFFARIHRRGCQNGCQPVGTRSCRRNRRDKPILRPRFRRYPNEFKSLGGSDPREGRRGRRFANCSPSTGAASGRSSSASWPSASMTAGSTTCAISAWTSSATANASGAQSTYTYGLDYASDAFVARLNPGLTALNQATYLGGVDGDCVSALALNASTGDVYVAGSTNSADFPGTSGGAPSAFSGADIHGGDAFVARLNPSLTALDQATYLGGRDHEFASALALDATTGEVYVAGDTNSVDFPGTSGGAQSTFGGGDTLRGDAFVARLSPSLTTLDQATYLGGNSNDKAFALALGASMGEVYVAGSTTSTDFPATTGGAQSTSGGGDEYVFVARLSAELAAACPSMPLNTCLSAGTSSVSVKHNPDAARRTVSWRWSKRMTPLVQGDFGDPLDGITSYRLCIYDDTAGVPMLKMAATVASGGACGTKPCWRSVREKGWAYKNKVGNATGITKVLLKGSAAGKPRVRVGGKGDLLLLPAPVSATKFFNQDPAVILQLSRTDATTCWSTTFGAAGTKTNSGNRFKARVP